MRSTPVLSTTVIVCLLASSLSAAPIILDFEDLSDLEPVTTQFPGLTFSNTIALTAGISLNEFEFPPRSGVNVVSDEGGPIEIAFAAPVLSFAGYFTYLVPITLTAFDALDTPIASASSLFGSNLACLAGPPCFGDPGSSPNELLEVSFAAGIAKVAIEGDNLGGSFVLDDAQYRASASTVIPEPSTLGLALTGIGLAALIRKRRIISSQRQP